MSISCIIIILIFIIALCQWLSKRSLHTYIHVTSCTVDNTHIAHLQGALRVHIDIIHVLYMYNTHRSKFGWSVLPKDTTAWRSGGGSGFRTGVPQRPLDLMIKHKAHCATPPRIQLIPFPVLIKLGARVFVEIALKIAVGDWLSYFQNHKHALYYHICHSFSHFLSISSVGLLQLKFNLNQFILSYLRLTRQYMSFFFMFLIDIKCRISGKEP